MQAKHADTLVIVTTGKQDRGARATVALGWACTALAMGQRVTVFFTMDGALWASDGATDGIKVDGFEPLTEYVTQFQALGGRLLVCAPCTKYYCTHGNDGARLRAGVEIVGLSTVVGSAGAQTQVITF